MLNDKVIIVSGIGPGLGSKLAALCAEEGACVVMAARTMSKLEEMEKLLIDSGVDKRSMLKVATDITSKDSCENLVAETLNTFGCIDVLINSAYDPGVFSPVDQAELADYRTVMDVNFFGTLQLTQTVVPQMKKQRSGSIVMVNTMAVHKPMTFNGGYAASKAALASVSAHLALELGKDNIRVNSVFLGWMWGASVEEYMQAAAADRGVTIDEIKSEVTVNIPLGRIPTDSECGKAVLFFASDYASAVTGASLDVNGGEYMAQ